MTHTLSSVLLAASGWQVAGLQMKSAPCSLTQSPANMDWSVDLPAVVGSIPGDVARVEYGEIIQGVKFPKATNGTPLRPLLELQQRYFLPLGELTGALDSLQDELKAPQNLEDALKNRGERTTRLEAALEKKEASIQAFDPLPEDLRLTEALKQEIEGHMTMRATALAADIENRGKLLGRTAQEAQPFLDETQALVDGNYPFPIGINTESVDVAFPEGSKPVEVGVNLPVNMAQGGMNGCGKGEFFRNGLRALVLDQAKLDIPASDGTWYNPQLDVLLGEVAGDYMQRLWKHCNTIADPLTRFAMYWQTKAAVWAPNSPVRAPVDGFCGKIEMAANTRAREYNFSKWTETTWDTPALGFFGLLDGADITNIKKSPFKAYNKLIVVYTTSHLKTVEKASKLAVARMANEMTEKNVKGGANVSIASLAAINVNAGNTFTDLDQKVRKYNDVVRKYNGAVEKKDRAGYAFIVKVDIDSANMINDRWVKKAERDWVAYSERTHSFSAVHDRVYAVDGRVQQRVTGLEGQLDKKVDENRLMTYDTMKQMMKDVSKETMKETVQETVEQVMKDKTPKH